MKINPVAVPGAQLNPNEGQSAGADRLARAKAVAAGQDPALERGPAPDPQVERAQNTIKKIRLKTQVSPDRHRLVEQIPQESVVTQSEPVVDSDTLATSEPAVEAPEATKPLSPQFAALAKEKREIQLARQKLEADKAALAAQPNDTKPLEEYRARIKANALSVLMEEGVTYDQLTEQILASNQNGADLAAIKAELKAEMKAEFENQNKTFTEREAQQEKQVLAQMERDTEALVAQGDDYEMIREAGYAPKVVELIHKVFKKDGTILDISEAANMIENELLEESLKFAKIKKVQSKLNPAPTQKPQTVQQDRPGTKIMRTLTNRDGASSTAMSKRERAIAAMEGRLK